MKFFISSEYKAWRNNTAARHFLGFKCSQDYEDFQIAHKRKYVIIRTWELLDTQSAWSPFMRSGCPVARGDNHYQGAHRSSATVCLNASHVLHRQTDRCINSNKSMRIMWQISAHDKNLLKIFQIFYLSKVTFQINYSKNVMWWRCNYMSSSYLYKYFLQISLIIIINIITFLRSHTIRLHNWATLVMS